MKFTLRSFIVGITLLCAPSFAFAQCGTPPITEDDLVLQLSSGPHGRGFIGTMSSEGARSAGAMYFDKTEGKLLGCDGTDWVAVLGGGSGADGATPERLDYKRWPNVASTTQYGNFEIDAGLTEDEVGKGDFTFKILASARRDSACDFEMLTDDGWKDLGFLFKSGNSDRGGGYTVTSTQNIYADVRVSKLSDGSYRWDYTSPPYMPQQAYDLTTLTVPFTGKFRSINSQMTGCTAQINDIERHP